MLLTPQEQLAELLDHVTGNTVTLERNLRSGKFVLTFTAFDGQGTLAVTGDTPGECINSAHRDVVANPPAWLR